MTLVEVITLFILPAIIAGMAGVSAFLAFRKKATEIKSAKDLASFLLSDEDVVKIINSLISEAKADAVNYDTVEEFIKSVMKKTYMDIISCIGCKDTYMEIYKNIPFSLISDVVSNVFNDFSLPEILTNIFNDSIVLDDKLVVKEEDDDPLIVKLLE